METTENLR